MVAGDHWRQKSNQSRNCERRRKKSLSSSIEFSVVFFLLLFFTSVADRKTEATSTVQRRRRRRRKEKRWRGCRASEGRCNRSASNGTQGRSVDQAPPVAPPPPKKRTDAGDRFAQRVQGGRGHLEVRPLSSICLLNVWAERPPLIGSTDPFDDRSRTRKPDRNSSGLPPPSNGSEPFPSLKITSWNTKLNVGIVFFGQESSSIR